MSTVQDPAVTRYSGKMAILVIAKILLVLSFIATLCLLVAHTVVKPVDHLNSEDVTDSSWQASRFIRACLIDFAKKVPEDCVHEASGGRPVKEFVNEFLESKKLDECLKTIKKGKRAARPGMAITFVPDGFVGQSSQYNTAKKAGAVKYLQDHQPPLVFVEDASYGKISPVVVLDQGDLTRMAVILANLDVKPIGPPRPIGSPAVYCARLRNQALLADIILGMESRNADHAVVVLDQSWSSDAATLTSHNNPHRWEVEFIHIIH